MLGYALPVLFTLFIWWFSTGAILYLDGLPTRTFRWSLLGATIALIWTLNVMADYASQTSVAAVYKAFACGILSWGWVEMSFLMGFITGPRRSACPSGSRGWRRAGFAIEAILYHELALIALGLVIGWLSSNAPNKVSLHTFLILWTLRQSTKLNIFFGVPNLSEEFLPQHLRYLQSYFTRKRMNFLFPLSVTAASIATTLLWQSALADTTSSFHKAQLTFLATLTTLGLLEHWFLVIPIPATALWNWGLGPRHGAGSSADETLTDHSRLTPAASAAAGAVP